MKFTSHDLAKAMGLKVGDKFMANGPRVHEMISDTKYLDGLYAHAFDVKCLLGVEIKIIPPKPILTEDEKVILRNLPKEYKWITRDCDGRDLCLHINKPERYSIHWSSKDGYNYLIPFNNLFNFIKWEDEPYSIEELLKNEI